MSNIYYNGVLLPEIPADVLAEYPYAVIAVNESNMQYQMLLSKSVWYSNGTMATNDSGDNEPFLYAYAGDTAWTTGTPGNYGFTFSTRPLVWSNHNIPNGSAMATEIYFRGSKPTLTPVYLVNQGQSAIRNVTSCSLTMTGCTVGNLLLLAYSVRGDGNDPVLSAGWDKLGGGNVVVDSADMKQRLYFAYKFVTSETEQITLTQTTTDRIYLVCSEYANATHVIMRNDLARLGTSNYTVVGTKTNADDLMVYGVTSAYYITTGGGFQTATPDDLTRIDGDLADQERVACWFDGGLGALEHTFKTVDSTSDTSEAAVECVQLTFEAPQDNRLLYNGALLPEVPADLIAEYPHYWIRNNITGGYYDLLMSKTVWWKLDANTLRTDDWTTAQLYQAVHGATDWTFNKTATTEGFGNEVGNRELVWTSSDILDGSSATTEVFFSASKPLPRRFQLKQLSSTEAESGILGGTAVVADRASYSKNVVVDGITSSGGSLGLTFVAPVDGFYLMRMYFTHSGAREFRYTVNGKRYSISVTGTSYYEVESVDFQLYLLEGTNDVFIEGGTTQYAPMFDRFDLHEVHSYGADVNVVVSAYLIRSQSNVYTVVDGVLSSLGAVELTAELFKTTGMRQLPTSSMLTTLADPEVLHWSGTGSIKSLTATVYAIPFTQTLESPDYFMTDSTVVGIEKAIAVATDDVQFAVSFDGGATWKTFVDGTWAELSETASGMSATTLNAIPTENWNAMATTGKFRFRISLMDETSEFTSLIVDYLNEAEVPAESNEGDE